MVPKLRTIAILMLLAGLCVGIFASRALRAMGGSPLEGPVTGGQPLIEQQVLNYQRYGRLDEQDTDRIRRELYRYDRQVRDKLLELRQQHADWFEPAREDCERRIQAILDEVEKRREP